MSNETFVARQPILDRRKEVYGYELLFRSGLENFFASPDVDHAAARVIHDSMHVFGLDVLSANRRVFVNATRRVVVEGLYAVLPKDKTVVELLESVDPDDEVLEACRALKAAGYALALDDFVWHDRYERLLPLVDVVKVDFTLVKGEEREELVRRLGRFPVRLLAEKVETHEEFEAALGLGFELFQGYFFFRPEIVSVREVPAGKLVHLALLQALHRPALDFEALEELVKRDVALSIRLVKYLNSAAFGWHSRVKTIRQAMVLLGEKSLRRWCSLIVLAAVGDDQPMALVVTCLVRARFLELLGPLAGLEDRDLDLFLTGMLSGVDALVGRPLEEVVQRVDPPPEIRDALLPRRGILAPVYQLGLAYERGDWGEVDALAAGTPLAGVRLSPLYREAVQWAERTAFAVRATR